MSSTKSVSSWVEQKKRINEQLAPLEKILQQIADKLKENGYYLKKEPNGDICPTPFVKFEGEKIIEKGLTVCFFIDMYIGDGDENKINTYTYEKGKNNSYGNRKTFFVSDFKCMGLSDWTTEIVMSTAIANAVVRNLKEIMVKKIEENLEEIKVRRQLISDIERELH
jgi:hypothetical protein